MRLALLIFIPVMLQGERTDEVFSHAVHEAADFACARCHQTATTGARAGFPTGRACLPCHRDVPKDKPILPPSPVYRLPGYVIFRHSQHAAGFACAVCHGDIWKQDPVVQVLPMTMKACVDCHKANHATEACKPCHDLKR